VVDEPLPIAGNVAGALRGNDAQWGLRVGLGVDCATVRARQCASLNLFVFAGRAGYLGEMLLRTRRTPASFYRTLPPLIGAAMLSGVDIRPKR
jgi:hypothetical protein